MNILGEEESHLYTKAVIKYESQYFLVKEKTYKGKVPR